MQCCEGARTVRENAAKGPRNLSSLDGELATAQPKRQRHDCCTPPAGLSTTAAAAPRLQAHWPWASRSSPRSVAYRSPRCAERQPAPAAAITTTNPPNLRSSPAPNQPRKHQSSHAISAHQPTPLPTHDFTPPSQHNDRPRDHARSHTGGSRLVTRHEGPAAGSSDVWVVVGLSCDVADLVVGRAAA